MFKSVELPFPPFSSLSMSGASREDRQVISPASNAFVVAYFILAHSLSQNPLKNFKVTPRDRSYGRCVTCKDNRRPRSEFRKSIRRILEGISNLNQQVWNRSTASAKCNRCIIVTKYVNICITKLYKLCISQARFNEQWINGQIMINSHKSIFFLR